MTATAEQPRAPSHLAGPERSPAAWRVVAAVCVMLAFSSGLGFYFMSVLLQALTAQRGFPVAATSVATALFFLATGFGGMFVASALERADPRRTVLLGAGIGASALFLAGRAQNLSQLFTIYCVFGLGFAGVSMVVGTVLITRWFSERRAAAMAVAANGLSLGGVVLTPLAARAVARWGIADATAVVAVAFVLGIVPITLLWLRNPPGHAVRRAGSAAAAAGARRYALRSRFFRLLTAGYLFAMLAQVGGLSHHFKLIRDRLGTADAAFAVSTVAGASVVGRFAATALVRYLSMRAVAAALMLMQGSALVLLGFATSRAGLLPASITFGLTVGSMMLMQPLLLAESFGARDFARVYSLSNGITVFGVAAGPALVGLLHDALGGYRYALTAAALASLLGAALVAAAGSRERVAPRDAGGY